MDNLKYDDTSSNPLSEGHLPVGGEIGSPDSLIAPDIINDMIAGVDDEDLK